ncbi:hypothetical protein M8C21_002381 [Ambrosia artemisiifolia]|uniref:Uncharacterized protein n=1 Tax=Ambrosia artemisiifolia TaxID=4212 RepID=A0AAD5BRS4_AMBAR|nr:hypothetical protein M8C21_002381 [Ambrosia artemisiifolia]
MIQQALEHMMVHREISSKSSPFVIVKPPISANRRHRIEPQSRFCLKKKHKTRCNPFSIPNPNFHSSIVATTKLLLIIVFKLMLDDFQMLVNQIIDLVRSNCMKFPSLTQRLEYYIRSSTRVKNYNAIRVIAANGARSNENGGAKDIYGWMSVSFADNGHVLGGGCAQWWNLKI